MHHRRHQRAPRVLFDVDEVLVDFQGPAFDIIEELTGTRYTAHDFQVWDVFETFDAITRAAIWKQIERPGWCFNLKPFERAKQGVAKAREMGFDVFTVTSPHHGMTWYYERVEALRVNFGIQKNRVIQTSAKFGYGGDAFVEDNPEHITAWAEEHPDGVAMLWDLPNTKTLGHDELRVRSWDEIEAKLQGILDARY